MEALFKLLYGGNIEKSPLISRYGDLWRARLSEVTNESYGNSVVLPAVVVSLPKLFWILEYLDFLSSKDMGVTIGLLLVVVLKLTTDTPFVGLVVSEVS